MTIGNITSKVRLKPTKLATVCIALLPVPSKFTNIDKASTDTQRAQNIEILQLVMSEILQPLAKAGKNGVIMDCADGKRRHCFPILSAWIADHMEHVTLHNIGNKSCPKCEVAGDHLGELPSRNRRPPARRDHKVYAAKYEDYQNGDEQALKYLTDRGVKPLANIFWRLPHVDVADLHQPDLLHNIYLGIFRHHLMNWVQDFLKKHHRLKLFDDVWCTMTAYPGFNPPSKAFREVSQWQGKEMRHFGRILLGALAAALRNPTDAQQPLFQQALRCVRAITDFHLVAQQRSHTTKTLEYMDEYLRNFHAERDIFLEFRASKTTKSLSTTHAKHLRADFKKETWGRVSAAVKRKIESDNALYLQAEMQRLTKAHSHFNFIKMHLLNHFSASVMRFGSLPQFSTEAGETAHKEQIKDGYRRSNHIDYEMQILNYYARRHTFKMREQNLRYLATKGIYTDDTQDVLHLFEPKLQRKQNEHHRSGKAFQSSVRLPLFFGREFTNPCRRLASLHRDYKTGNKTLAHVVANTGYEDLPRLIATYLRTQISNHHLRRADDDVESLLGYPAWLYQQVQIPVNNFQEEDGWMIHKIRCTGKSAFRNKKPRNDWAWLHIADTSSYGDLKGCLPARIDCLIKLRNPNTLKIDLLALVTPLQTDKSGACDRAHGLVRVSMRSMSKRGRIEEESQTQWIVSIRSLIGMAHLIAESAENGNKKWFVNSRIDLETWYRIDNTI